MDVQTFVCGSECDKLVGIECPVQNLQCSKSTACIQKKGLVLIDCYRHAVQDRLSQFFC